MGDEVARLRERTAGGTLCIVPYCHPDFAWTHHREWHAERYCVGILEALDLMREHEAFRFCVEPWIDQIEPFLDRCPDRVEELRGRLNDGRMGVKASTLASPRPATCPDETFLRNMTLGRRRYRAFAPGAELSVMACPDVGIGHSQLPQIVRLAGACLYRGWRSDAALSAKGVPREFLWQGLDGTSLLVSRGCYGGLVWDGALRAGFEEEWGPAADHVYETELAVPVRNSTARVWWIPHGMDDGRPLRAFPSDEEMPLVRFMELWNEREDSTMRFATPGEFLGLLEAEVEAGRVATVSGAIDPVDVAYNAGWHGERGLWRLRMELDSAVCVAERACALARLAGAEGIAGPDALEALWTESCRVSSHALQWVFTRDWRWITLKAREALQAAEEATDAAVAALSGVARHSDEPIPLALFNPLPYARTELVELPWVQPRPDRGGHRVLDADGREVALQLGEQSGETWGGRVVEAPLLFEATVPAMGCAVYRVEDGPVAEAPPPPEGDVLDTGALRLCLSGRGLQRIEDVASGLVWEAPRGGAIADVRLFEMGPGVLHIGPIAADLGASTGTGRWVLTGPLRWVYRWEGEFHGHRVRQDIIADRGARHVDLISRVYCAGTHGFFALCMVPPVSGPMHVDIPFGVEPRDLADEPYAHTMPFDHHNIERHREGLFWARSFVSVSGGDVGVSLVAVDGDRYFTWEAEAGEIRHILLTATLDDDEDWEAWVHKDRLALGWHTYRHRLVLHAGDWRAAGMCGVSDRLRTPLRMTKPLGPARPAVASAGLLVSPTTVRLSAFHEEADGSHFLRVYESAGDPVEACVTLPAVFATAARTDLNGEPRGEAAALDGRALRLALRPWEIATVVLSR